MREKEAKLELSTVLVVADLVSDDIEGEPFKWRHDLEKSSAGTVDAISKAIESLGASVLHLSTLDELTERASQRRPDDVVLSIFGGERSRNRMALVPAICESFGIRFIGPDVYGRVVCQDKEISKMLAVQSGMITPWYRMIRSETDLVRLGSVPFPVVIKPNMEGSSIGISDKCRAETSAQVFEVARELLYEFKQPVLVERFVGGNEVSVNVIESIDGTEMRFAEVKVAGNPHYFDDHLFGVEIKAPWIGLEVALLNEGLHAHLDITFHLLTFLIQAPATWVAGQHFVETAGDACFLADPEQQIRDRNSSAVSAERPNLQEVDGLVMWIGGLVV